MGWETEDLRWQYGMKTGFHPLSGQQEEQGTPLQLNLQLLSLNLDVVSMSIKEREYGFLI